MLVRFIIDHLDPQSGRRQGLFQAAHGLRHSGRLTVTDDALIHGAMVWFGAHLATPTRFALSPRPHRKAQALSWFKDTAREHIAKMHGVASVLDRYGTTVRKIRTDRPGYVLYEDSFQVAAYPFADTQT